MFNVSKGTVTTVESTGARVESVLKKGDITKPLTIPEHIEREKIKKGTEVAFVVFDDMTGVILALI